MIFYAYLQIFLKKNATFTHKKPFYAAFYLTNQQNEHLMLF